jgi:hypothetical protein
MPCANSSRSAFFQTFARVPDAIKSDRIAGRLHVCLGELGELTRLSAAVAANVPFLTIIADKKQCSRAFLHDGYQ